MPCMLLYCGGMYSQSMDALLQSLKVIRQYEAGASIFREGEIPVGVFFVKDGTVGLSYAMHERSSPQRVAGPGEILGLSAIATGNRHECSATATAACEIGFVDRADLLRALEERPATWLEVLHFLSGEVTAAYDELRRQSGRRLKSV
ncbi:MAG: cyclic nucleotide-binding domain-containing protein [Acidobacteriota bacterium]